MSQDTTSPLPSFDSHHDLAEDLVRSAAHELRGPLGIIRNSAYLLRRILNLSDQKLDGYLAQIQQEVDHGNQILTELVEDIRDNEPQPRLCSIWQLLESALERVPIEDPIRVERHFDEPLVEVKVDPGQIERLFAALLRWALRAMPTGGVLSIECTRRGEETVVSFTDTGPTLSAEALASIFDPPPTGGARQIALGLALAQRYARRNGGRLECESRHGTVFRLTLPVV